MRINQPHLSVKVASESQDIEFVENKIEETQEGKEPIQSFLKRQNIDEAVVAEKLIFKSQKLLSII